MLAALGYRLLEAPDADRAALIIDSGRPIHLLFTDVVMPGALRSPELARRARARWPGIAVLYTSGYTQNAIVHGGRLDAGVELLPKPYTAFALASRVRDVLNKRPAHPPSNDPEETMKSLRRSTENSILMVLDESQRAKWDAVTRDTLPSS